MRPWDGFMIVNTRRLFCRLLRVLGVETVCDIGSMDGHGYDSNGA